MSHSEQNALRHLLKDEQGFTLIELLAGVSIFSIIISAVYATFVAGITVKEHGQRAITEIQEVRMAMNRFSADLQHLLQYRQSTIEGDRRSISFYAAVARVTAGETISWIPARVEYTGSPGSFTGDSSLTYHCSPLNGDSLSIPLVKRGLAEMALSYAALDSDGNIEWRDSWKSIPEFPLAIKVEILLKNEKMDDGGVRYSRVIPIGMGR